MSTQVANGQVYTVFYLSSIDSFKFKMASGHHLGNVQRAVTFEPIEINKSEFKIW